MDVPVEALQEEHATTQREWNLLLEDVMLLVAIPSLIF